MALFRGRINRAVSASHAARKEFRRALKEYSGLKHGEGSLRKQMGWEANKLAGAKKKGNVIQFPGKNPVVRKMQKAEDFVFHSSNALRNRRSEVRAAMVKRGGRRITDVRLAMNPEAGTRLLLMKAKQEARAREEAKARKDKSKK